MEVVIVAKCLAAWWVFGIVIHAICWYVFERRAMGLYGIVNTLIFSWGWPLTLMIVFIAWLCELEGRDYDRQHPRQDAPVEPR